MPAKKKAAPKKKPSAKAQTEEPKPEETDVEDPKDDVVEDAPEATPEDDLETTDQEAQEDEAAEDEETKDDAEEEEDDGKSLEGCTLRVEVHTVFNGTMAPRRVDNFEGVSDDGKIVTGRLGECEFTFDKGTGECSNPPHETRYILLEVLQ